jgi:hypothetical protein
MTNLRSLTVRLRESAQSGNRLAGEALDEIERLTRQRNTYRDACATKQDLIDRILLQSVPGELSAERKAELRDRPRVTRAELAKSRLQVKHAESDYSHEPGAGREVIYPPSEYQGAVTDSEDVPDGR